MTSRTESIRQGVAGRAVSRKAHASSSPRGATHQIPVSSQFCAVCFLIFGSQEKRAIKGGKVAHLTCLNSLRGVHAA